MNTRPWLIAYPPGVPADIDASVYPTLVALMEDSFQRFADRAAFCFMGRSYRYAELDSHSRALAAYLQSLGLAPGDRVALMLPNTPQYLIAAAAVLRAGLVVVNVNPLYTPRELAHQLKDSGARAIVLMENFAHTLQQCEDQTPVQHLVLCTMGDCLGMFKGALVNAVLRWVKKAVPRYALPKAVPFKTALAQGRQQTLTPPALGPDHVAVLQYTGGTTGVSKGAVLLHRNLVANVLQSEAWNRPVMRELEANEQPTTVCALPLYHIFAFTVGMMLSLRTGGLLILIPNPRDLTGLLRTLQRHRVHIFPAVNTLFAGLVRHPEFDRVDWSPLKISLGGGAAVQSAVAQLWQQKTGCPICEGYGLSETSPTASCNPTSSPTFTGTVGLPLPSTWFKLLDEQGQEVPAGEPGEIAIRGPQLMAGYWQQPEETARVMTPDGYFRTGDVGVMDSQGFFRIVDRKKDMVLVSGFNVYPSEIEDLVTRLPGVLECAVVGVPDAQTGEAVKLVVVKRDSALTEADVRAHCQAHLTGYKRPRWVEFRSHLPKSPVGKVLRRELRESLESLESQASLPQPAQGTAP